MVRAEFHESMRAATDQGTCPDLHDFLTDLTDLTDMGELQAVTLGSGAPFHLDRVLRHLRHHLRRQRTTVD